MIQTMQKFWNIIALEELEL